MKILTTTEAAMLLGRGVDTLRKWRATGEGPPWRSLNGRFYGYVQADVEAWIESMEEK